MTRAEFLRLAESEANEVLLHASYSYPPEQFAAVRLATHLMVSGIRSGLEIRFPSKPRPASPVAKALLDISPSGEDTPPEGFPTGSSVSNA